MPNIRTIDFLFLDPLFEMESGYVLDFSNRTFTEFFANELNIDIDDPRYQAGGSSKGKRLRYFLNAVDRDTAARTLEKLWEYREASRQARGQEELVHNAEGRFRTLIDTLGGKMPANEWAKAEPVRAFDREKILQFAGEFSALADLDPQPRGYAFEKFLAGVFNFFGMEAKKAFRLVGEQIDGSFLLGSETYLLEAKWQNMQAANADLGAFHSKLEQKAAWTRGLFVSYAGFSAEGLNAFGRGRRVVCMDGLDVHDALSRELPLNFVLERKVRAAAETGRPFVQVRELFP